MRINRLVEIWRYFSLVLIVVFFFFQAEDGIRDLTVTGVQTCALPISRRPPDGCTAPGRSSRGRRPRGRPATAASRAACRPRRRPTGRHEAAAAAPEIGRASCRERGEISVVAGSLKKKKKIHRWHAVAV